MVGCVKKGWLDECANLVGWVDALIRSDWMDTLSRSGWMDAISRGILMDALSRGG